GGGGGGRAGGEGRRGAVGGDGGRGLRYEAGAWPIACEPPAATGQSATCPVRAKRVPTAAVSGFSSGRIEWVAQPPSSARARRPLKRARNARVAGRRPGSPKRASRMGCHGIRRGPRRSRR